MPKKIIFCADGTWDTEVKKSNVWKFWNALNNDDTQSAFYDDGVGSDGNIVQKLLGGATGVGLWKKIKAGYETIAGIFVPGDAIYLVGFSRGAYTARSVAGMIAKCGLPTKGDLPEITETAFQAYRSGDTSSLSPFAMYNAKIVMVGVWDTVGSLGIPGLFGGVDPLVDGFLDTKLHPNVTNAYQALAIDEHRTEFLPALWTQASVAGQAVEQVWFCGAHSDVGGADADQAGGKPALADISLAWMMRKANALGLVFKPEAATLYQRSFDGEYIDAALDASWNPLWGVEVLRSIAKNAVLADSVVQRCRNVAAYRSENLTFLNGVLAEQYGVELVTRLQTTATA